MDSLAQRIVNYELLHSKFDDASLCFSKSGKNIIVKSPDDVVKFDLNNVKKLGEGAFNKVYLVSDNIQHKDIQYVIRINKNADDDTMDEKSKACISDMYSLYFSNLVKDNIFPNFPLVINSFLCGNNYIDFSPITIQEYAEGDSVNHYINHILDLDSDSKKILLQTILTYFFMNNTLSIAHNDANPSNIIVKNIETTNISYKFGNIYFNIEGVNKLALITDFDRTRTNIFAYNTNYFTTYYKHYAVANLQSSVSSKIIIDVYNKILKLSLDSPQRTFMNDLFTFACTSLHDTVIEFMSDLFISNMELSESIGKHFSDICNVSDCVPSNYKVYNLDIKIDPVYTTQYKMLYLCAYNNDEFRKYKGDPKFLEYLNETYKLNRFIGTTNSDSAENLFKFLKENDFFNQSENEENYLNVCMYIFNDKPLEHYTHTDSGIIRVSRLLNIMNEIFTFLQKK